jgi:hypothetical protein
MHSHFGALSPTGDMPRLALPCRAPFPLLPKGTSVGLIARRVPHAKVAEMHGHCSRSAARGIASAFPVDD